MPHWQRIEQQRLSPLYVSVHATEPELRSRLRLFILCLFLFTLQKGSKDLLSYLLGGALPYLG